MKLYWKVAAKFNSEEAISVAKKLKVEHGISEPCKVDTAKVKRDATAETESILVLFPISRLPHDAEVRDMFWAKYIVECQGEYRRQFGVKADGTSKGEIVI